MDEWWTLRLIFVVLHTVTCSHVFFHEPSSILVKQNYDFGFALSQWNNSLIASSPSSDLNGTVYRCPLTDIAHKSLTCYKLDLFNSTTYTRDVYPEQHFYLGASIAATKDYLFTCAPMVTKNVTYHDDESTIYSDAVGSCFLYNDSISTECHGPDSVFRWNDYIDEEIFQGGTGWNTLADEENGFLLVAKTSIYGDIFYFRTSGPKQLSKQDPKAVFVRLQEENSIKMLDILSLGYGMTAGKFFSNNTVYAFSKQRLEMTGQIVFLEIIEDDGLKTLRIMLEYDECPSESCIYTINNEVVGGMFGYALGAADMDADGFSELLVGAPLESDDENEVEFGAIHIYFGGDIETLNDPSRVRTIFGANAMGRFGSAIATTDTDGDGISEVFVSAPYEDSGAVYVLSGRELREKLLMPTSALTIQVSQFKHSQRLAREGVTGLGFSLLSMSDVDGNGCNELAIGAPGASSVILLRCLQTINVNITYELKEPYVKEKDDQITLNLCLQIRYNTESNNISGKIIAKNYISGAAQLFPDSFKTDLSKKFQDTCRGVVIQFSRHEKFIYELTTKLEIENTNSLESKDFDTSWAKFGSYSQTENSYRIHRTCEGDDCNPNLSLQIKWNHTEFGSEFESKGHKKDTNDSYWYEVESSKEEMISIVVVNKGFEVSEACVWVEISGAPVYKPGKCSPVPPKSYECGLPMPFRRTDATRRDEAVFEILLNMTSLSDVDKALVIVARPKNKCDSNDIDPSKEERLIINYSFNKAWEKVHVKGINSTLSVSDIEISEEELKKSEENILKDEHQYTITNEGSLLWNRSIAIIQMENRPFIIEVGTIENRCNVSKDETLINFTCPLMLPPSSTKRNTPITVWIDMSKRKIANELQKGRKINLTSTMKIYMDSVKMTLEPENFIQESIITDIRLRKETSIGQNKNLIGIIAALLAILLLVLIIFCLYKKGFFKRKQKKNLNVLRESVRRHSIRLASEKSSRHSQKPSNCDDDADIEIEVVEDCPFEEAPIGSKDKAGLIEADVHKEDKTEEKKEEHTKNSDVTTKS